MMNSALHSPYVKDKLGALRFKDHPGQRQVFESEKRFTLMLAGTQSGKTVTGPWWLLDKIKKRGPGDYIVATPTYPLMQKKVLPEFLGLFKRRLRYGEYKVSERIFEISDAAKKAIWGRSYNDATQVFFGHAQDPDSLESATGKAAWLDEPGQKKFKLGSWEALQRRLSIYQGPVLLTTTPYTLGWLKSQLYDKAKKDPDGDIKLIQFNSLMNPHFPREEYERMKEALPSWKFNMMYRGVFERPAGMIYDCFTGEHKVPRFTIPKSWKRFMGLDFGGVNTAAVYIAQNPQTGQLFVYDSYHKGGRTAREHTRYMLKDESAITAFGGAGSEDQWRDEFTAAGLPIHRPPVSEVEVGIDRVYELIKTNMLCVFSDLDALIDEIESYSRETNEAGEITEKIEDKSSYHLADALRYICSFLNNKTVRVRRHSRGGR